MQVYVAIMMTSKSFADSTRFGQDLPRPSSTASDDSSDIQIERSGAGYNVSWTFEKPARGAEDRVKRYVVKWYDALGGQELGSANTTANEPYTGEICKLSVVYLHIIVGTIWQEGAGLSGGSREVHPNISRTIRRRTVPPGFRGISR